MKKSFAVAIMAAVLAAVSTAATAASTSFTINVLSSGSSTQVSGVFGNDPGNVFSGTNIGGNLFEINIGGGHTIPGDSWPFGFMTAAWADPVHSGLFNNVAIIDPTSVQIDVHAAVAVGDNLSDYPGGFSNGVAFHAGTDAFNDDVVFARVFEQAVVSEPAALGILGLGLVALGLAGRRSNRA